MAIKGPKGTIPTQRGWVHERTGELLKSQRITAEQISEWYGKPTLQTLHEAPHVETFVEEEISDFHYAPIDDEEGDDDNEDKGQFR